MQINKNRLNNSDVSPEWTQLCLRIRTPKVQITPNKSQAGLKTNHPISHFLIKDARASRTDTPERFRIHHAWFQGAREARLSAVQSKHMSLYQSRILFLYSGPVASTHLVAKRLYKKIIIKRNWAPDWNTCRTLMWDKLPEMGKRD